MVAFLSALPQESARFFAGVFLPAFGFRGVAAGAARTNSYARTTQSQTVSRSSCRSTGNNTQPDIGEP